MSRWLIPLVVLQLFIPATFCAADSMTAQGSGSSSEAACTNAKELAHATALNICGANGLAEWKFQDCTCTEHPAQADKNGSPSSGWQCEAGYDYSCKQ